SVSVACRASCHPPLKLQQLLTLFLFSIAMRASVDCTSTRCAVPLEQVCLALRVVGAGCRFLHLWVRSVTWSAHCPHRMSPLPFCDRQEPLRSPRLASRCSMP